MVCDYWECQLRLDCEKYLIFSGAKYPPCARCVQFDTCGVCMHYVECADLVTKYLPNMFRRLVKEISQGLDIHWDCRLRPDCEKHLLFNGATFLPCASCVQFDSCSVCANYIDCANLVSKFLPNMFRRLVKEIREGEDTQQIQQIINRYTLGGRKRG